MAGPVNGARAGRLGGRAAGRVAWLTVVTLWGCTSVNSAADRQIAEQRLPRPAAIVVHDFAVAPEEVDPGQPLAGARLVQDTARTEREKGVGHAFADEFSVALVEEIRKLGLPAQRAAAPNLPSGDVLTIEGRFISLAGDPSAPGIVGFSGDWPERPRRCPAVRHRQQRREAVRGHRGQRLARRRVVPAALLPDPTITAGQAVTTPGLSPAQRAKLQTAAREAAGTVAAQLKPYFAGQGWIARAES